MFSLNETLETNNIYTVMLSCEQSGFVILEGIVRASRIVGEVLTEVRGRVFLNVNPHKTFVLIEVENKRDYH